MTDNIVDPSQYAVNLELIEFSYKLSAVDVGNTNLAALAAAADYDAQFQNFVSGLTLISD